MLQTHLPQQKPQQNRARDAELVETLGRLGRLADCRLGGWEASRRAGGRACKGLCVEVAIGKAL